MKLTKLSPKTQNIIAIVAILMIITTSILGYGVYSIYTFFRDIGNYTSQPLPKEIEQARVLKGNDFLNKIEMFKLDNFSFLETIKKSATEPDKKKRQIKLSNETAKGIFGFDDIKICADEIIAVGQFGGYVFSKKGDLKREIIFEPAERKIKIWFYEQIDYKNTLDNLRIIDFENDGKCEFISNNSIDGVTVFNSDGNVNWRYGKREIDIWKSKTEEEREKEVRVTNVDVGDLDNDGVAEIIISQKADGVRAFDINKKEIWFQPDDYPTAGFEFVDIDGDGSNELFQFQGAGSQIRDNKTGDVVKKIEIDYGKDGILQTVDKNGNNVVQIYNVDENELTISDLENNTLIKAEAPLSEIQIETKTDNQQISAPTHKLMQEESAETIAAPVSPEFGDGFGNNESIYKPKAVWVKLKKDEPKYFAIVGAYISFPRANLYVYSNNGKLVYHELLPEDATTIAVLPTDNELEKILIGGKNTIWKFSAK